MTMFHVAVAMVMVSMSCSLFPQSSAYTDLENFIRVQGCLDTNVSVVNYRNGSVFWKQPGTNMRKIFNFEGFNINRKLHQPDGTFLSLSREIMVYRDPAVGQILHVWMNPATGQPNEVFYLINDPANFPIKTVPRHSVNSAISATTIVYSMDTVIEYPNPLSPDKYPKYSAGEFYDTVNLFRYFANYTLFDESQSSSLPMTGTWMKKSQFLPWMEMGTTPGSLYYTALSWKCYSGLSCVSDDIMQIINTDYPKYRNAPTTDEQPNQTSWDVFKKVVDQRRQAGLPDIIISPVEITNITSPLAYTVDPRVDNVLYNAWPLYLRANTTVSLEVPGKQSATLFDLRGNIAVDYEPVPWEKKYRLQFDGFLMPYNHTTDRSLSNITNPYSGAVVELPQEFAFEVDIMFPDDSFYTVDIPESEAVGLVAAQSVESELNNANAGLLDNEAYSVNLLTLLFPYSELAKTSPDSVKFYGSYAMFQNAPDWLKMGDIQGTIVYSASLFN